VIANFPSCPAFTFAPDAAGNATVACAGAAPGDRNILLVDDNCRAFSFSQDPAGNATLACVNQPSCSIAVSPAAPSPGQSFTLSASCPANSVGLDPSTYGWTGTGASGSGAAVSVSGLAAGSYSYTVSASTPGSAGQTYRWQPGSVTVVVAGAGNAAPVVTASAGFTTLTIGGASGATPVPVDDRIVVADTDSPTLASAFVAIAGGFHASEDMLFFNSAYSPSQIGNISGSYNPSSGVLSLLSAGGSATLAQWQAALRAVSYANTAANPSTANRLVTFTVSDGAKSSTPAAKTVVIARAAPVSAALEIPQPGSYQSGIGLVSGWSCKGPGISISIDGQAPMSVPYGSARADVASTCSGIVNTGFGLLINFNSLGAGTHMAQLYVNGSPSGLPAEFTVTAPAGEFVSGVSKDVAVADFPATGESVLLRWQQAQQNFAIAGTQDVAPAPAQVGAQDGIGAAATLENPQPGSYQSGIGLFSGWSCRSHYVSILVDSRTRLSVPYGSNRADTASVCGADYTNSGFGLLFNFNTLGAGVHSAQLLVDGLPKGDPVRFTVTVPANEFLTGASKGLVVSDFPRAGAGVRLVWDQSRQNFAIRSVDP
jgi:hypothetical protein